MDQHTRDVLEIEDLLELMSKSAACSLGREWILALSFQRDIAVIDERLSIISDAMKSLNQNIPMPFGGMQDIRPLLDQARLEGTSLEREDWPPIRRFAEVVSRLRHYQNEYEEDFPRLVSLVEKLEDYSEFASSYDRVLNDEGQIRNNASPELASIRQRLQASERTLKKAVNKLVRDWSELGALQEDFATVRGERFVLPVKAGSRGKVKGVLHGSSSSGETFYIEPIEVLEPANEAELLREEVAREIHRILLRLTSLLRPLIPQIREDLEILAELDGLYSVAKFSWQRGWKIPVYGQEGSLKLFNAHHPLLQEHLKDSSVPITVSLDSGDRVVVISGPNAGGKTTAMKTTALCCFLLQSGCPVPVSADSRFPIFSGLYADIGDRQDLSDGLSTYSGHMRRMSEIIREADNRSLVLLDELGTGTDPDEGGALAQALLENLSDRALLTISTSHLAPLKVWAEETKGARNASFSLDPNTQKPTFHVRLDLPGASEALVIAENEGMPANVLKKAETLIGEQKLAMGKLLQRIEGLEKDLAHKTREAAERVKSLETQEKIARTRAEELREEKRQLKTILNEERKDSVLSLREEIESLIANLPSEEMLKQRKDALNDLRHRLRREQDDIKGQQEQLRAALKAPSPLQTELRVGMKVFVRPLMAFGEVLEVGKPGRKSKVLVGSVETEVGLEELSKKADRPPMAKKKINVPEELEEEQLPKKKKKKKQRSRKLKSAEKIEGTSVSREMFEKPVSRLNDKTKSNAGETKRTVRSSFSNELDLHGFRVDEALAALDKYIDRALLADYHEVRIVHGLGQGKLYRAVHEYLRTNPSIKHYRFALDAEGGGGVTIVEL